MRRDFGEIEHIQTARKAAGEFVTQSDLKAEQIIFEILFHARPDYGFVMEEKGVIQGKDKTHIFYIDPLDGTNNFMHKNPHFATSIGLAREGQLVAGVIYNPITDDMFFAEKGQGAYLNNKRLRVSKRTKLEESLFAFSGHYHPRNLQDRQKLVEKINISAGKLSGIRHTGSSALDLAYVGAGRFDGIWGLRLEIMGHRSRACHHPRSRRHCQCL